MVLAMCYFPYVVLYHFNNIQQGMKYVLSFICDVWKFHLHAVSFGSYRLLIETVEYLKELFNMLLLKCIHTTHTAEELSNDHG